MPTVAQRLAQAQATLAGLSDSPTLDAAVLLAHALGQGRAYLYTWPDRTVPEAADRVFQSLLARRAKGEPVAYLIGHREFWGLNLHVSTHTLIPRPDTERLVELALQHLPGDIPLCIADLGTGSGAIALALGHERPACQVIAIDRSADALAVAQRNAARLGIGNVEFRLGDWCAPLRDKKFDMIVANPPYIAATDPHLAQGDVRFEPRQALTPGLDALHDLRAIATCARAHLMPGGWLLLEHGYQQGAEIVRLLRELGYRDVACHADYAGLDRVSEGRWG